MVRTIGQAFEECNKMSQEQFQEKQHLEEVESASNVRAVAKGSDIVVVVVVDYVVVVVVVGVVRLSIQIL